ncbi:tol-pal system protein YbgF [Pseudochrobactrum sp. Wa41.01b-1]|uniref:tol-pal system protein YbgF n=1 Tax=Pseudochrobactrum sp. Wa41.01b-1 TaxID=2864102 RepID=UPI001C68A010|nr:tol-pal system protein YbgF [Pseudochrobactrum sp. Wa41.01b-1]QYM74263.1 tol-pal system protein YbgF [Pseudochrobactrum sp. Wa41.01b-1]
MKKAMKRLALAVSLVPLLAMATGGTTAFAQASDQRVIQLQEQVRDLTGKLEEMNFQILQMQEQMRKIQEDNEFRFEELEKKKKADAGSDESTQTAAADSAAVTSDRASADKEPRQTASANADNDNAAQDSSDFQPAQDANTDNSAASVATGQQTPVTVTSQAPRALGSIRFDSSGNVIGGSLDDTAQQQVVSLPQTDNPNELYNAAYQFILAGDYRSAEVAFRAHIDRYPADPMTSDARYWLGEALYGQDRFAESATVFIDNQRDFPDSKRGAENMLKLGMAMAKLNDREVACATLAKISSRFPSAAPAVLKRADEERKLNRCS